MFTLANRHLYLCVGHRSDMSTFLPAVLRGGVDVVQLREKDLPDAVRIATARLMIPICRDFAVPFIMNDSPELALLTSADGVHVGQDDVTVAHCRALLGDEAIIGLSTHSSSEFDDALRESATYLSSGPIVATPTKPGRAGVGLALAVSCQSRSDRPVYVTGGVNEENIARLVKAGLSHFVVVRAINQAADPERTTREIRRALDLALG